MTTFNELRNAVLLRQHEWSPRIQGRVMTLSFRGNELAGEVGEACNIIKKLERKRLGLRGSEATIGALAQELADVVICVDLIAAQIGIDLGFEVQEKFNATSNKYGLETRLPPFVG